MFALNGMGRGEGAMLNGTMWQMGHVSILLANLDESSRRRNLELPLPTQERAYLSDRLQFGHVCLKENSVDGTTAESHVISEQSAIVSHDHLCPQDNANAAVLLFFRRYEAPSLRLG